MTLSRPKLMVIAGPTASGKTGLAVAAAKRLNGEIVSADSMQIYREVSIGTARPSKKEMQGIPHHMIGFYPLTQYYSVSQYAKDARGVIHDILQRGKQPILCGGTGLYIDAIVDNLQFLEDNTDFEIRERLKRRAQDEGAQALLDELRKVDEPTAMRLHPNNLGRIIRALELYETTGMTMSEQIQYSHSVPPPFDVCYIVLDSRNREYLYDRINCRVDNMMQSGLLEEARRVLSEPTAPTVLQAIGYKELAPYIQGKLSLDEAVDNLKRSTRRYAKRQLSWFRRRQEAQFIYIDEFLDCKQMADTVCDIMKGD